MRQSVPNDGGRICMEEAKRYVPLLGRIIRRKEPPVAMPESHVVFSLDPPHAFLRMTGFRPPPDDAEDHVIHARENPLGYDMPMVVRPSPDNWVEPRDQCAGWCAPKLLDHRLNLG